MDEVAADDDTTYVQSANSPGSSNTFEVGLSDVTDPCITSDHIIKFRARKNNDNRAVTLNMELYEGATKIAETGAKTLTTSYQTFTYTLSAAEAGSINDYTDLRFRFVPVTTPDSSDTPPPGHTKPRVTWAELEVPEPDCPEEGCSLGFWKNHTDEWTTYTTGTTLGSVFTIPVAYSSSIGTSTFAGALEFDGGPTLDDAAKLLLKQAVAALLNAEHADVDYPRDSNDIISDVNTALNSLDRDPILELKDDLDEDNNLGCPLDDE